MKVFAVIVHYAARALAILLAVFLSSFVLEGFDPAFGWQSGVMHGLLALFAIGLAWLAHKKPLIGGLFFIGFGLFILTMVLVNSPIGKSSPAQLLQLFMTMNPVAMFIGSIGALFLLDAWLMGRKKKAAEKDSEKHQA